MIQTQIGAVIGIIITFISISFLAKQKLTRNVKSAFFGAFLSFLIIYTTGIFFNVFTTINTTKYVPRMMFAFYILFCIFITNLILFITKYRYIFSYKELLENLRIDKFLLFYYIFMFSGIIITLIIPFSHTFLYGIYLLCILIAFLFYPTFVILKFLGKKSIKEKLKKIVYFLASFYGIMVFAFIGFIYITAFKRDIFGIVYIIQGFLLFFAVYNYSNIKDFFGLDRKKQEYEKFYVGNIYLIEEDNPNIIYDIFKNLPKIPSLFITRTFPDNLKREKEIKSEFIWLSETQNELIESIPPTNVARILSRIKNFIIDKDKSIIIIDNLNYLIFQNNFVTIYKIINTLAELTELNNSIVLVSMNIKQLEKEEIIMIERECEVIK